MVTEKVELRAQMRASLRAMSTQEKLDGSERICRALSRLSMLRKRRVLMAYVPMVAEEPDILPFLRDRWQRGLPVALPRMEEGERMVACLVESEDELERSGMGMLQPTDRAPVCTMSEVGAVLVPGLAFQIPHGRRLGRGGGHYDRFLSELPGGVLRMGVAFEGQLRRHLPVEAHDETMSFVLTPGGLLGMSRV